MSELYNSTALSLSAPELRQLTKWDEKVIIEFLSLTGQVKEVSNIVEVVVNNISAIISESQNYGGSISRLNKGLADLAGELSAGADSRPALVALAREVQDMSQLVAVLQASKRPVRATITNDFLDARMAARVALRA